MELETQAQTNYTVTIVAQSVVKAIGPVPESYVMTLSNLDLLSGRFPVTYFYFYGQTQYENSIFDIEAFTLSLAKTLSYYYPFAGRIIQNQCTGEPEIICDNTGALILEAKANIQLEDLDFYNLNESLQGKLAIATADFPVQVQVTSFTCGGISVSFTFDHALGDATAFGKFLLSWSEIAQHRPPSCTPNHQRSSLQARSPPSYHPSLDQTFIKCSLEEILNMPPNNILLKRLYYIDASCIRKLQELACINGKKRTKIEAFSAYVWKIMVNAIDKRHDKCKMGWLVDGRSRINGDHHDFMSNYIGNVLSLVFGEAKFTELKEGSISDIANKVHDSINEVTKEAHFLDLIDWIECHRPGLMLSRAVLGREGPALVVSSGRRFPVAELNFGFGTPVLGTQFSSIERIGVGYMNQRQSAKSDGSWTVSAILWPQLAAALEADSVFELMSAAHLHLIS